MRAAAEARPQGLGGDRRRRLPRPRRSAADVRLRAVAGNDGPACASALAATRQRATSARLRLAMASQPSRDCLKSSRRGRRPRARRCCGGDLMAFRSAVADLIVGKPPPHAGAPGVEAIGMHRLRDGSFAYGVGLAFGHADATTLERLAAAADAAGASGLRTARAACSWSSVSPSGCRRLPPSPNTSASSSAPTIRAATSLPAPARRSAPPGISRRAPSARSWPRRPPRISTALQDSHFRLRQGLCPSRARAADRRRHARRLRARRRRLGARCRFAVVAVDELPATIVKIAGDVRREVHHV